MKTEIIAPLDEWLSPVHGSVRLEGIKTAF